MKVFTILSIDNWLLYSTAGQEAGCVRYWFPGGAEMAPGGKELIKLNLQR